MCFTSRRSGTHDVPPASSELPAPGLLCSSYWDPFWDRHGRARGSEFGAKFRAIQRGVFRLHPQTGGRVTMTAFSQMLPQYTGSRKMAWRHGSIGSQMVSTSATWA